MSITEPTSFQTGNMPLQIEDRFFFSPHLETSFLQSSVFLIIRLQFYIETSNQSYGAWHVCDTIVSCVWRNFKEQF